MAKVDPVTKEPMSDDPDGPRDQAGGKKPDDNRQRNQDPNEQAGGGQHGG
ncbi:MAG TPA: hypothetical protein VNA57_00915 [Acidimicrobiales bacterium]|nr:hypothetical protein [Acidimicrobiales bacterium]